MQLNAALRERNRADYDRAFTASESPHRKHFADPLEPRLECPLGRLRVLGAEAEKRGIKGVGITEAEYLAGVKWRNVYASYLHSIQSPEDMTDEDCAVAQKAHDRGIKILEDEGKRVSHAVNAIVVYEDPEELGDYQFTITAARIGLAQLAKNF